jgi:predicted nucleotidyltransferase
MVAADRLAIASAFAKEQIEQNPDITAVFVHGSAARNDGVECSDIDIRLLVDDCGDKPARPAKPDVGIAWREGIFIDAAYVSAADYSNAIELLKHPYLAGSINDAVILFDRSGVLTKVKEVVIKQFMEPEWLNARVSSLIPSIKGNWETALTAAREGDEVAICRASIFALWTSCDMLLVSQGISPSWVRGLQKLEAVLPAERERIIEIEGSSVMTPKDVSQFVPFYVEGVKPGPGVMFCVQKEMEWMIDNGLHREALHSLWVGVGIALRTHILLAESGETGKQNEARSLAHAWLTKVNWRGEELEAKVERLGEYVTHATQLVNAA